MSLNDMPNEVLAQIVSFLPFKDLMSVAFASWRLKEVVRKHRIENNCGLEIWRCGSPLRAGLGEARLMLSHDVIVAASSSSTDIYEYCEMSDHLYRTTTCPDLQLLNENQEEKEEFCLIPGTTSIVMSRGQRFSVYDLSARRVLFESDEDGHNGGMLAIAYSRAAIAITVMVDDAFDSTTLYSWDGAMATRIRVLRSRGGRTFPMMPELSVNGVMVYRPNNRRRRLRLHDAHRDVGLGKLVPDIKFEDVEINADGSRLVLTDYGSGLIAIYNIATKTKMFQMKDTNLVFYSFSNDLHYLLCHRRGEEKRASVLHLTEADNGQLILGRTSRLEMGNCEIAVFRNIHNHPHLQTVEDDLVLKVFKLSLPKKTKAKKCCVLM